MPQEIIVTVFGSSRPGEGSPDYEEACVLGRALAKHGFVVCNGGTGTLVELAVVWEMLNKSVMSSKPLAVLGGFWAPVLDRVREVELGQHAPWGEANGRLVYVADSPGEAAQHLQHHLR